MKRPPDVSSIVCSADAHLASADISVRSTPKGSKPVIQSVVMAESSEDITLLLNEWRQGDADAFDRVTEYVYSDLRRRAAA